MDALNNMNTVVDKLFEKAKLIKNWLKIIIIIINYHIFINTYLYI
jgi:hypothetical protein